ncbi:MAG: superoxide dismutase family protein [Oscillospiraceae bacterium]|nr:superoxide dismutase family protein [Oscillospiraceae bacterium]
MAYCKGALSATAQLGGSPAYPNIRGTVRFAQTEAGVLVTAEVFHLPDDPPGIFAFHIHEGTQCSGNAEDPFADAGGHYNPGGQPHPYHAGDLPPLFGNHGYAYLSVFTNRFTVREIIGRVVIIHAMPDDFISQPAGNAGAKIACGQIFGCFPRNSTQF